MTVLEALRAELVAAGLVRAPNDPGAGARPWLPPAWKHPDGGAIAPGDKADEGAPEPARDDGLVVSLMHAPGVPPSAGEEERRVDGVDVVYRGRAVPDIVTLDAEVRAVLLGDPPDPGGRSDWVMGGVYVIQSRLYRALQPVSAADGVFTFVAGWLLETRA